MMPASVFWGVLFGGMYFLAMWWIRTQRLNEQRRQTRTLYALCEQIVGASSPEAIAGQVSESLPVLLRANAATVFLYDRASQTLRRIATEDKLAGAPVNIDQPAPGLANALALCFRNRTLLMIGETRDNALVKSSPDPLPRSLLLVPLVSHEEILGVISVDRLERAGAFTSEEQTAAQHVANQIASALKLQEQQSLREQLFRGEKLAAAGQMIASIAAELHSPLQNISSLSGELLNALKRRDDIPAVEAGLDRVAIETARTREIVARLASFNRRDAAAPRHLDLLELLKNLTRFREPMWREQGLLAQHRYESGPLTVMGAEAQLEQVLLALAMHVEKEASMTPARTVSLRANESTGQARIEIGYSLPPGVEPPAPENTAHDNSLSLEMCTSAVVNHGGQLKVHRRPGVFAFEVLLPLVARSAPAATPAVAEPQSRPLTLMLVDPEPAASRPLLRLLNSRGHRVVPVAGEEAAELSPRLRFDAVFWSARPGRASWGEFLERVRASVGAFVLVSDGYNQDLAQSLEQNGGFLLSRPVEERSLDRILREIGSRGR
jgi:signal transduction histidine kinase